MVREPVQQVVDAADHRQLPWAWWQPRASWALAGSEDDMGDECKEEGNVVEQVWQEKVFHAFLCVVNSSRKYTNSVSF